LNAACVACPHREPWISVKPPVNLIGGQLTELAGTESRDNVRVGQNGVPRDGVLVPAGLTEFKPITNSLSNGVARAVSNGTVFVIADYFAQFLLGGGFRLA